jgi:multiple antibiotic resistance protein
MSTLLILGAHEPGRLHIWFLALTLAWVASVVILLGSGLFHRLLKDRGLRAMEKLMGMILTAVAAEMIINGLRELLKPAG